ncbi:60 kDa inner membrane insertion protein [Chloroherpeton thalassium ATCC 35110]|uniref:Membrane protein insertase YidC n=1 Tax=Chloroherpeton thalassium (strain ATCC 35110 / GB-78) TaxID=517418 RepID=YIDC_CHLT3|nr:membrane protein insertase YidC [Chloroherpeton thalassium]B3QYV6.1 RecName: Full=Membrane protein insertase YidC; AltName: Full=Foldase YidC; AltName: Full=Membrane integrase YidC; AltName: Full=Membrane protein YidC [Chloroherpeton thalassium ATCC 35110]ACF15179.1 60 kDa inner membrane insertion protein [Chloroherpeton thalassium ATCC 35110]
MDRNTLIGLVLIALIMMAWFQLMAPKKPLPEEKAQQERLEAVAESIDIKNQLVQDSLQKANPTQKFGELGQFAVGEEKKIQIETDLFTATLSTKGATLRSFIQKDYLNYKHEPFNLISNEDGTLSLFFATRDGKVVNTGELYFDPKTDQKNFRISGDNKVRIPFEISTEDGRRIEITYIFSGNSYEFGYETNLAGFGKFVSGNEYQVVWTGGLSNAEKNVNDEATNSYAEAYLGGSTLRLDASHVDETYKEQPSGNAKWVAVRSKYFVAGLISKEETEGVFMEGSRNTNDEKSVFEDYMVALKLKLPSDQTTVNSRFSVYIGPLKYDLVKATGSELEKIIDFGWEWVTRPFAEYLIIPIFNFLNNHVDSYGVIIILFALFIKLVTYPLTMASTKSMKKMAALQPQLKAIQEQYKDNPEKLQAEISGIYREAGVNPLGGCLPTVIQMPLLFAMFYVFRSSIQLRQEGFLWSNDLSVPDSILDLPFSIPLYGDHVSVIPILMGVAVFFQQKLTPSTQTNDQMKFMMYLFPGMMLIFFNNMPSGLGLYYLMFNVFSIAQQFYINQTTETEPVVLKDKSKQKAKPARKKK